MSAYAGSIGCLNVDVVGVCHECINTYTVLCASDAKADQDGCNTAVITGHEILIATFCENLQTKSDGSQKMLEKMS
jgi:hypothetical protein